ncbi:MAG: rod shape-determining protein MreD [Bacillota bacterium]|nr:rod shape-determining protein MreD [Bacillota bacterium]
MKGAITGFVTYLLATSWIQYFRFFGVIFNAGIVLVVLFALLSDRKNTISAAFVYGILVDFYASRLLGINLLLYLLIAFVMLKLVERLYRESITLPYLLFFISTAMYYAGYMFIMAVFRMSLPFSVILKILMLETLYNLLVGIGMYYLVMRFKQGRRTND